MDATGCMYPDLRLNISEHSLPMLPICSLWCVEPCLCKTGNAFDKKIVLRTTLEWICALKIRWHVRKGLLPSQQGKRKGKWSSYLHCVHPAQCDAGESFWTLQNLHCHVLEVEDFVLVPVRSSRGDSHAAHCHHTNQQLNLFLRHLHTWIATEQRQGPSEPWHWTSF